MIGQTAERNVVRVYAAIGGGGSNLHNKTKQTMTAKGTRHIADSLPFNSQPESAVHILM